MLTFVERSTIQYLKKRGFSNTAISEVVGHHRDTIKKVLDEPVLKERTKSERQRKSAAAIFDEQIEKWLEQSVKIKRMLELAQADPQHPYLGGETAFYDYVRKIRKVRGLIPAKMAVRFEGLPGEFVQIDWGEVRNFPFTKTELQGQTRYFFAARLKYSRFMFVGFTTDMVEETLLSCLIDCFNVLGGVPWVVTTDNMKTVTLGRDKNNHPIWHPAWQHLANEFSFHPEACAPASGNQKGAVENLVKFVKSNFINGRTFYDSADLDSELASWLYKVNYERECDATQRIPAQLLAVEQPRMGRLPASASDYGFFDSLVVNREGFVTYQTNKYSVPARLIGQALTARIFKDRIELFSGTSGQKVASHLRSSGRNKRVVEPVHFEAAFEYKPRARVMVYRDWLVKLSPVCAQYISEICRSQRGRMNEQMVELYALAQRLGTADFVSALELAAEQHLVGAEYVSAIASTGPGRPETSISQPKVPLNLSADMGESAGAILSRASLTSASKTMAQTVIRLNDTSQPATTLGEIFRTLPAQNEVERDLEQYEQYVANRQQLLEEPPLVMAGLTTTIVKVITDAGEVKVK